MPFFERIEKVVNLAGWDVEISKVVPWGEDLNEHRPLGISCAAIYSSGAVRTWPAKNPTDHPFAIQLSPEEARAMARDLEDLVEFGIPIATWNGVSFDFRTLAEECQDHEYAIRCAKLAMGHYDLGFQMITEKGFMCKLDAANKALGLAGKLEGMHGALAPVLWSGMSEDPVFYDDGIQSDIKSLNVHPGSRAAQELCLDYVGQDCIATVELFEKVLQEGELRWITTSGNISYWKPTMPANTRFLTVRECLEKPQNIPAWARKKADFVAFWMRDNWYAWMGYDPVRNTFDPFSEGQTNEKEDEWDAWTI